MFLKKIELSGFKSFADKTVISIDSGITAIIGPNGSGKSNISDALKWVLGEQGAKRLRGDSMEDLIFKGSNTRKPISRASVKISISNDRGMLPVEFSEVSIGRRILLSGESEYLINNSPCRLKDIYDLFMDTGLNKGSYSIISQGQVGDIIMSTPYERRYIFEQAAGIERYKRRTRQAEDKIKATLNDMERLMDILTELERQLRSLNYQAKKAERYKKVNDRLKGLKLIFYYRDYQEIIARIHDLEEEKNKFTDQRLVSEKEFAIEKTEYEKGKTEIIEIDNRLNEIEEKFSNIQDEIKSREIMLTELNGIQSHDNYKIDQLKNEIEENNKKINEIEGRCKNSGAFLIKLGEDHLAAEIERNKYIKQLDELTGEIKQLEGEIETYRQKIETEANRKSAHLLELKSVETEGKSTKGYADHLKNKTELLMINISEIKNDIEILNENHRELKVKIEENRRLLKDSTISRKGMIEEREKIIKEISDITGEIHTLEADLKILIDTDRDKYLEGVNSILKMKEEDKTQVNVRGLIADTISTEEKFETAIGIALNEYLQYIIVEKKEDIKELVKSLNNEEKGRATFIEFQTSANHNNEDKKIREDINNEPDIEGFAIDKIHFNSLEYLSLIRPVFSRYVIVSDFETGYRLSKKYGDYNFITLNGEIFRSNGGITGGKLIRGKNILRHDREKIEVKIDIAQKKKMLEKKKSFLTDLTKRIELTESSIETLSSRLQETELEMVSLNKEIYQKEQELIKTNLEKEKTIKLTEDITFKLKGLEDKKSKIMTNIRELEKSSSSIKNFLHKTLEKIKKKRDNREDIDKKNLDFRVKTAELNQKKERYKEELLQNNRLKNELLLRSEKNAEKIKELKNSISDKVAKRSNIEKELNKLFKIKEEIKGEKESLIEKKSEINAKINNIDEAVKEKNDILMRFKDKESDIKIKLSESKNRITIIEERLNEEYSMSIEKLKDGNALKTIVPEEIISETDKKEVKDLKKEADLLKNRLNAMGDVNIHAINEYNKIKERYDFLIHQKEDLEKAEKDLRILKRKNNERAKIKFLDTFNRVNNNFRKIISRLFEGGEAELLLIENNEVLDAGIEIQVKPPGKKVQSIRLLSGGEKTLVAIGLLFALFEEKPSPICILDEIDAPLDDANVERFVKLLTEFSRKTQFIIITHNKNTMSIADNIFGVTMEEKGVSKILSVKFNDKEAG